MTARGIERLDRDLIQSLLTPRFPSLEVHSIRIDGEIHGTATKVRIVLDASGEGPRTMWIKAGWEEASEVLRGVGIFSREPRVYAELLPQIALETPICFGAEWDEAELDGIVLLEDLAGRNALIHTPLSPLAVAEVRQMLSGLAQMHASFTASVQFERRDWLRTVFGDAQQPNSYFTWASRPDTLAQQLTLPRGAALPESARNPEAIAIAMRATVDWGLADSERSVLHGDAHIGNSYRLPDGTPGLLDWQCASRGGWGFDVSYYLASSLDPADRRAHERELIEHYVDERRRFGSVIDPDRAFESYCRYLAYGLTMWLTNSTTFQPEEFNAAVASRFAIALCDHGLLN